MPWAVLSVHKRIVLHVEDSSGGGSAGCVVHIVHKDMVTLWVAPTSLLLNTADQRRSDTVELY